MRKFKVTKGEWFVSGDKYATIESRNTDEKIVVTHPTIATVNSTFINPDEFKGNAKLIVDAGNTFQKCDLLPSEMLAERDRYQLLYEDYSTELQETKLEYSKLEQQQDELLAFLNQLINHWASVNEKYHPKYVAEAKELITKIETT